MIKFNWHFSLHICMRYTRTVSHNFYQRLVHPLRVKTDANIPNVVTVINHRLPRSRQVGLDVKQWHPLLRGVQLSFCVFQISDTLSNTTKLSQLHSLHLLCSAGLVLTLLATTPERFFSTATSRFAPHLCSQDTYRNIHKQNASHGRFHL